MFERILLPIDPARPFGAANQFAVDLARRSGSKVVATYIIDEHLLGPVAEEAATSVDNALEWIGRDAMDDFIEHHQDLEISKTLAYGNTPTVLFQMVLQTGADCVVLGGYHGPANPHVWGSTVVDIVHHAERPVFVVREHARLPGSGDNIVVPFDGSQRPLENLHRIAAFASELEAGIDLVYVARAKDAAKAAGILEKGRWVCNEQGIPVEMHVLPSRLLRHKGRIIHDHAVRVGSPLIATSRLGATSVHTGRSRTVGWLLTHATLPVWVVRK